MLKNCKQIFVFNFLKVSRKGSFMYTYNKLKENLTKKLMKSKFKQNKNILI